MTSKIARIVIVGGGSIAWIAAAALRRAFRHLELDVAVVDTGAEAGAPVGRWTLPSQRGIHAVLGLPEAEVIRRTGATFKIASEFLGWQGADTRFIHAHGELGADIGSVPFYKFLLREAIAGRRESAEAYSLAATAARLGRFARPMGAATSLTSSFTYGFHLEEASYTALLRAHAERCGVRRVAGALARLERRESGGVEAIVLDSGEKLAADYFLDCSGAQALLMSQLGPAERDDWSRWLPCDRMWSAAAAPATDAPAMTRIAASDAGWLWRAPLAGSSMVGHAYGSAFVDDDTALRALRATAPDMREPIATRFTAGRRRNFWAGNCVALGGAAVDLEPLAGADLHLAQVGLGLFLEMFPLDAVSAVESVEYDRLMGEHADALRDFTLAHYRAGPARPGAFWAAARSAPAPERLAHKLDLFQAGGRIILLDHETFEELDWAWLLIGSGAVPAALEVQIAALIDKMDPQQPASLRAQIERLVASMPPHMEYVRHQAQPPR